MQHYKTSANCDGRTWTGDLIVGSEVTIESIWASTPLGMEKVHEAEFPTKCLGNASRDEYLRVTLASIIDKHGRES